ncbi:barstar family protein [Nocardia sp. 2YAB30]
MWRSLGPAARRAWLSVALRRRSHPPRPDDPPGARYELDGRDIVDEDSFYCAIGEAVNGPGGYFGWNLDALDDCMCGGFCATPPFTIMARAPRDREAERSTLRAAADRLLAGTPLRSKSGKLTTTELITESGLRRDVVYDQSDLVDEFKARLRAQHSTPAAFQRIMDENASLASELTAAKRELAAERATTAVLRKAITELSLELSQAHDELAETGNVTRLPTGHAHGGEPV